MKDTHLLRTLIDAEAAASAVAVQLVSFKDVLPDGLDVSKEGRCDLYGFDEMLT